MTSTTGRALEVEGRRILVRGNVQGVGFRPFVYGLALRYSLSGWVIKTSEDVKIEVEGSREKLEAFISDLEHKAPPLACIESISADFTAPVG